MGAPEIINAAVGAPQAEWSNLLRSTRDAIASGHYAATSFAYTVLGLGLEHGLANVAEADVLRFLLDTPDALSPGVLERIRQFAAQVGATDIEKEATRLLSVA